MQLVNANPRARTSIAVFEEFDDRVAELVARRVSAVSPTTCSAQLRRHIDLHREVPSTELLTRAKAVGGGRSRLRIWRLIGRPTAKD